MAYPTVTTCTKCGNAATLARRDDIAFRSIRIGRLPIQTTKLGYVYRVNCPHCGFRFMCKLRRD
jgi:DNA-directed RNA polymerase subunit RPC12/RpoP